MLARQLAQAQRAWFSDNGKVNAFGPPSSNINQRAHLYDPVWITPKDLLAGWLEAPNNLHSVAQHTSHAVTLHLIAMVGRTFRMDERRYLGGAVAVGSSLFQDKRLQLAGVAAFLLCAQPLFHQCAFEILITDLDQLTFDNRKTHGAVGMPKQRFGLKIHAQCQKDMETSCPTAVLKGGTARRKQAERRF